MSQAHRIPTFPTAHPFPPLAYKGTPVLTTEMLAQAYEVTPKQIRQNFANNRDRFIEGKHFFPYQAKNSRIFVCASKISTHKFPLRFVCSFSIRIVVVPAMPSL